MTDNEKMKFYREALGYSRRDFSKLTGYAETTINKTEMNRIKVSDRYRNKVKEIMRERMDMVADRLAALMEILPPQKKVS